MSKKNFYFQTFYSLTQSGPRVYVYGSRAFTKEAYLRAARNTFLFPGMGGEGDGNRDRACGNGNGEGGRGWG